MVVDRRVQRTRTALYDALIGLIREKDYESITVADILAAANVGRSTFYAHFTSKDDLLARSLERLKALLHAVVAEHQSAATDPHAMAAEVSRALFRHVGEFRDVQLALAGGRGAAVLGTALAKALNAITRDLPLDAPRGVPRELAVDFAVDTFRTVLRYWLERKPDLPADAANELYLQLVYRGLGGAPSGGNFRKSNHVAWTVTRL